MTTQHTPEPVLCKHGRDTNIYRCTACLHDEAEARKRLIAAAPDLLAACEAVLGYVDSDYWTGSGLQVRNALWMAIAKAQGK